MTMKKKNEPVPLKNELILYQTEDGKIRIEVRLQDETVWLTQKLMAELFQTSVPNINIHINNIFKEGELLADSVIKEYLTTAADNKKYQTKFYNLDVIISVGYRVKSHRGTQFRIWATQRLGVRTICTYPWHGKLSTKWRQLFAMRRNVCGGISCPQKIGQLKCISNTCRQGSIRNAAKTCSLRRTAWPDQAADQQGQTRAVLSANAEMILTYWDIGRMILERQEREGWGASVIPRLAQDLRNELPEVKGFSERNIGYMIRFAREYGASPILQRAVAKLQPTENKKI